MAEAENNETDDYINILKSGSEQVFDYFCEFCRDSGKYVEAEGFCIDCEDYLCQTCVRGHTGTRMTRHHDVLDKESMPKGPPMSVEKVSKDIATKCSKHKGKAVEYYCESHYQVCCSDCLVSEHAYCRRNIVRILDKADVAESLEYNDLVTELTSLRQGWKTVEHKIQYHVEVAENCHATTKEAIKKYRAEMNRVFIKRQKALLARSDTVESEEKAKMEHLSSERAKLSSELESIISELDDLKNSKKACQLYIKMKWVQREMTRLKGDLRKVENGNFVRRSKFKQSAILKKLITDANSFGYISVFDNIDPIHLRDLSVLFEIPDRQARRSAYISGCVALQSHIIAVDHRNERLVLLSTDVVLAKDVKYEPLEKMVTDDAPWGVTKLTDDKVAVTIPKKKKIIIVEKSSTNKLSQQRELTVNGECYGVDHYDGKLVVSFLNTPKVEVLDLDGKVRTTIVSDKDGHSLFKSPKYVRISNDGGFIYVSDSGRDAVLCLTFDGDVNFVYEDLGLSDPRNLCVNNHGIIYVCNYGRSNVHMITPEGVSYKVILKETDKVCSICILATRNKLFVGREGSGELKMYELQLVV